MSTREDVERGILVYTCNCGWLDTGHADSRSRRPHVGAASLWGQITAESGLASQRRGANGFKVTYAQDMRRWGITVAETRSYFVRRGLSTTEKESVALTIFMEVSYAFEQLQGSFPFSLSRAGDSSFSEEDLVSDLIGFYVAVRPGIRPIQLCRPVSRRASLAVWDTYGPVGSHKNRSFSPVFHPCDECRGTSRFPPTFQQIAPAPKGDLFRDWIVHEGFLGVTDDDADQLVPARKHP